MANTNGNQVITEQKDQDMTLSQRFTAMVIKEASSEKNGGIQLTGTQRRLVQGYFVMIDRALKIAEENRVKKNASNSNSKFNNEIPYNWNNVNISDLVLDAVHYARLGLDMQERNHLFPIPYANRKTNKYDITFTVGYSGIQYIAEKFALIPPQNVTVEVVYSNDKFRPLKKSASNPMDNYEFEIVSPFDRGEIIGGFGYIEYDDSRRNELVIMTINDILKRMGKNANAEFWGTKATGKKIQSWDKGQKVMVEADGWLDEMCRKTIIREVYGSKHIPRDPSKIDDNYQYLREREVAYTQAEIENEANEAANTIPIDIQSERTPENRLPVNDSIPISDMKQDIEEPEEISITAENSAPTVIDPDF